MSTSDDFRAALVADMINHRWRVTQYERVSLTNGAGHELVFTTHVVAADRLTLVTAAIHVSFVGRYEHKIHGNVFGRANPDNAEVVAKDMRWAACVEAGVSWAG